MPKVKCQDCECYTILGNGITWEPLGYCKNEDALVWAIYNGMYNGLNNRLNQRYSKTPRYCKGFKQRDSVVCANPHNSAQDGICKLCNKLKLCVQLNQGEKE